MKGICIAGNMSVDHIYPVETFPERGTLVHILDGIGRVTGGAVCNVIMDLAKMDDALPLRAAGRLGRDADGDFIMECFHRYPGINTDSILRCDTATSFTAVISDTGRSERTMFTYTGSSGTFSEKDIDWEKIDEDLVHIAYIMLLNTLDEEDGEYGTRMARMLHDAQVHGKKTSVDVVSESADRFRRLVPPALKYVDYCTINEIEAEKTTGIALRSEDGVLMEEKMLPALEALKEMGVSTWAVIHAPEGGFGLDDKGRFHRAQGLNLPDGFIQGTVGAGDAFCAGILYAVHERWPMDEALRFANAAAVCSLRQPGSTDGLCSVREIREIGRRLGAE